MNKITWLSAALTIFVFVGLTPVTALAAQCGNYPLTPEQSAALEKERLEVVVPEGEVPFVQRCDIDLQRCHRPRGHPGNQSKPQPAGIGSG